MESCCFTGHRQLPSGDGYLRLVALTEAAVREAVSLGCHRFFAGGALGFDMLAALLMGVDAEGNLFVLAERCLPDLTLREAALAVAELCRGFDVPYAVASPDLWNRRQDTGRSGFEVMQAVAGMPPNSALAALPAP